MLLSIQSLNGSPVPGAALFLHSSERSIAPLLTPWAVGQPFVDSVRLASTQALEEVSRMGLLSDFEPWYACPLRGGEAYLPFHASPHEVHRFVPGDGTAIEPPAGRTVVIGDTVARGSTLEAILQTIVPPAGPWELLVHGYLAGMGIESLLRSVGFEGRPAGLQRLTVVAYEAVFDLPPRVEGAFGPQDFLRSGAIASRRYRAATSNRADLALEKCAIYDMGDRARSPLDHDALRGGYWDALEALTPDDLAALALRRSGVVFEPEVLVEAVVAYQDQRATTSWLLEDIAH